MSKSSAYVAYGSYVEPSRFAAPYIPAVAKQLENLMPTDASADETRAMQVIRESAASVAEVELERERLGAPRVRPPFLAFANAWSGAAEVIGGFARMEGAAGDDARAIASALFADGVSFVKLDALAGWGQGQRRLDRIALDGLAPKLASLIGASMLGQLRESTQKLGDAIGAGTTRLEIASPTALSERTIEFARAVAAYARLLAGKVDETSASSVERFTDAMAPIDAYRAARKGSPDEEDDDVLPPPPTPPAVGPIPSPLIPNGPFTE